MSFSKTYYSKIKLLILDMDGTLTDGKVYINGEYSSVSFSVKDGAGIWGLKERGIPTWVVSGGNRSYASMRLGDMGVSKVFFGIKDKKSFVETLLHKKKLDWSDVAYMGDDLNDLDCLEASKISAIPQDAHKTLKANLNFIVTPEKGGEGAVRYFTDYLIEKGCV